MSWKNVVGHEESIRLLAGQLKRRTLPPAILFVGQRGIGKRTLAVELARAVSCIHADSDGACGKCLSCQRLETGAFADFLEVLPRTQTNRLSIEQVRNLEAWIQLRPQEGALRTALLDEADQMTEEAVHALLKLVEEPPPRSLFLLIASTIQRLPATLVSRCAVIRCLPQGIQRVSSFLTQKEKLEPSFAQMLAALSGGRLGAALEFHRQGRLSRKNEVLDELLAAHRHKVLEVSIGQAPRTEVEEALEWWAAWWRDLIVLKLAGDSNWLIHRDRLEDLKKSGVSWTVDQLMAQVERTYEAKEAVARNASPRVALAALLAS